MDGKLGDFGRGRVPEDDAAQQENSLPERSQEDLLQQLLNVLYTPGDRQAAIGAAARAVMSLQHSEVRASDKLYRHSSQHVQRVQAHKD
jgi:hypothetical protein